jgi:hypothetical protein
VTRCSRVARACGAALALPVVLAGVACSDRSDQTAIVLEVVDGTGATGLMDEVVFRVTGPGILGGTREARAPLQGPDARTFPLSLALIQGANGVGPFAVVVEGRRAGEVRARAASDQPIAFVPRQVVRRRFELVRVMAVDASPGQPDGGSPPSGDAAAPDAPALDAPAPDAPALDAPAPDAPAPVIPPIPPPDAAPTPPPDAPPEAVSPDAAPTPPDAGPGLDALCSPSCPCAAGCDASTPCVCPPGCSCVFSCRRGQDCEATCRGGATTCTIVANGASRVIVRCLEGASCRIDGGGAPSRELTVTCTTASCELDCGGAEVCKLDCKMRSGCLIGCATAQKCELSDCPEGVRLCADGARVCRRGCP